MAGTTYTISLVDRVSRVARQVQGSLNRVRDTAERVSNAIDGIGLIAGGAAVAGIFKLGAELESTQLKFNTLTGSVEAGTKLFNELTEFANATPFSNQALNDNANTLLAFGEKASGVTDTLRMLGDIAAGDQEKLKSLTLAFAQSQSAGKLMGQDLLQMINAGFNPLQTISEQTGKSIGQLKDEMSRGSISADMVRNAFKAATQEGGRFYKLTENMSKTMAGKWSTVMGKAKFIVAEFGLSMKDIFTPFIDGIIKAIEWVSKYRNIIFPLLTILTTAIGVITALGVAFKILNIIMAMNPIILIIAAIAALIAVFIVAYKRSSKFREILSGVWEVMKTIYTLTYGNLIPVVKRLSDMFSVLFKTDDAKGFLTVLKDGILEYVKRLLHFVGSLAKAFNYLFEGEFKKALKSVGSAYMGVITGNNLDTTIIDAYKKGAAKASDVISKDGGGLFGSNGLSGLSMGLSPEAQKLQAQGVVSGGIKTFNITIGQLTGVETLSTNNITDSASKVGDSIIRALTSALADIKNVD